MGCKKGYVARPRLRRPMRPSPEKTALCLLAMLLVAPAAGAAEVQVLRSETVDVKALAVMSTPEGLKGATSDVAVSFTSPGSGHVFVDTRPLAQVDMQGSARVAVRVAGAYAGVPVEDKDFFVVVRGESPVVGGPSAGGLLAVAAVAALRGWQVPPGAFMTGTINLDGSIGPIGGLLQKAEAAAAQGGTVLAYPAGQETAQEAAGYGGVRTVRMADHCGRLRLRCVPVADLGEAVRELTGMQLLPPVTAQGAAPSAFRDRLDPLARQSVAEARSSLLAASAAFDRAALPRAARAELEPSLSVASRVVIQAEQSLDAGRPYTAASRAFRASIEASYVREGARIATAGEPRAATADLVARAKADADASLAEARALPVTGFATLETAGAAQQRADEARRWASQAGAALDQGRVLEAVRWASQALARAETARWWAALASEMPATGNLSKERLEALARDLVDNAAATTAYAAMLMGANPEGVESRIGKARAELDDGLPAAAVIDALQAESDASVGLVAAGTSPEDLEAREERARTRAADAIARVRAAGNEPFLAQSYLELSEDTATAEEAYALAGLAGSMARLSDSLIGGAEPTPSRFVGQQSSAPAALPRQHDGGGRVAAFGTGAAVAVLVLAGPMLLRRWSR